MPEDKNEKIILHKKYAIVVAIALVGYCFSGFSWAGNVETRIAILETRGHMIDKQMAEQREYLIRIEKKVDDLIRSAK